VFERRALLLVINGRGSVKEKAVAFPSHFPY
jgi:hypothetical protein